jgi:riboflavin synthase
MFTGIVTHIGRVTSARPQGGGLRLRIDAPGFGMDDVGLGDSIAIQGVCHTVVAKDGQGFEVDTSRATLDVTTGLEQGRDVNLEKSLRLADRLGGHLVQGHVDGVATVDHVAPRGDAVVVGLRVPDNVREVCIPRGSITVDGVSLTVDALPGPWLVQVSLIPFTRSHTTLGKLKPGDRVHVEGDMIGKYVRQLCRSEP